MLWASVKGCHVRLPGRARSRAVISCYNQGMRGVCLPGNATRKAVLAGVGSVRLAPTAPPCTTPRYAPCALEAAPAKSRDDWDALGKGQRAQCTPVGRTNALAASLSRGRAGGRTKGCAKGRATKCARGQAPRGSPVTASHHKLLRSSEGHARVTAPGPLTSPDPTGEAS